MPDRHHMDHIRGAKLRRGDQVVYDNLELYLACHEKSNHRKHWHGYFLIPASDHLEEGVTYKLILPDKREGDVNIGELKGCQAAAGSMNAVDFHVVGDFHGIKRGLETPKHGISY